jgi:mannose-1-phosphate guanylyltransferase
MKTSNIWALVLAAGSGTRLERLTVDAQGRRVPKQFWSLTGGPSLLRLALARAHAVARPVRTAAVVAQEHRRYWLPALMDMTPQNIVEQPANRGTAFGILLPLLHILRRDRDAKVVLLPSDHHVGDESAFTAAMREALTSADGEVTLLGITPDRPDTELGYIVPGARRGVSSAPVLRFVEKPALDLAAKLVSAGALWNSFVMVGRARLLADLIAARVPNEAAAMRFAVDDAPAAVARLYGSLRQLDFSRDVVPGNEDLLRVVTVAPCGWTDLGTPDRVEECLRRQRGELDFVPAAARDVGFSLYAASSRKAPVSVRAPRSPQLAEVVS